MQLRVTIFRGTAWAAVSNSLSAGLTFVTLSALARLLGPDEFGIFALAWSIVAVFTMLADFGLGNSVARHLAQEASKGGHSTRAILRGGLSLKLLSGVLFSSLCFLTAPFLGGVFHEPRLIIPLQTGALIPLLASIVEFCKFVFKSQTDIRQVATISGIEYTGKMVLAVLFVTLGYGVTGAIAGHLIALGLMAVFALWRVYTRVYSLQPPTRGLLWHSVLRYCFPFVIIALAVFVYTEMSNVMLGLFSDALQVGYYNAARTVTRVLTLVSVTLGVAIGPSFVELQTRSRYETAKAFHEVLAYSLMILIPLAVLVGGLAPVIVPIVFGQQFLPAVPTLQVLGPFLLFFGLSAVVNPVSDYLGKAKFRAIALIPTVLAYLVLGAILSSRFGATGAAWAVTATYIPYGLANVAYVSKLCRVNPRVLGKQVLKISVSALIMVSVFILVSPSTLASGAVCAVGACTLFVAGLLITRSLTLQQIRDLLLDLRRIRERNLR